MHWQSHLGLELRLLACFSNIQTWGMSMTSKILCRIDLHAQSVTWNRHAVMHVMRDCCPVRQAASASRARLFPFPGQTAEPAARF